MEEIENYTFEEEARIVQSATKRKQEKREHHKLKEKQFLIRSNSIQQYFIRLSSGHKKTFILRLMRQIRSLTSVLEILHVMSLGHAKITIYADIDPETTFIHDKLVLDHDRMLDQKVLKETMDTDTAWFASLDDSYQITLVTNLIRLSAGVVKRKLYLAIFHIYYLKLKQFRQSQQEFAIKQFSNSELQAANLLTPEDEDESEYDPKHPATLEVEKQRKKWDDMISKYRSEVELARLEQKEFIQPDSKKKLVKNQAEVVDGKSKKEKKQDTKNTVEELDLIQLLPIWVVKKIFRYLDEKTLISLKKVNNYWSFTVQELLKEIKAREHLDNYLNVLKSRIEPEKFEKALKTFSDEMSSKKPMEKTKGIYYEIGAIPEKIVPKYKKNLAETSLISDFVKQDNMFSTGDLVSFPRLIKKDIEAYRHHACFLQDVNVRFDVEHELERQRSFLTYSLTSLVTSLTIDVNEEDLSDW
ncbi:unnamed protein product [Phaedon cochleariae]|uniref:F-box domain-containing protein n=1 Tax=Phaedon cochleariae TaxID=80249 RepID=A0A9P0GP23_PHACE|nr:unnamed protein product [Phaedon cochleariae]